MTRRGNLPFDIFGFVYEITRQLPPQENSARGKNICFGTQFMVSVGKTISCFNSQHETRMGTKMDFNFSTNFKFGHIYVLFSVPSRDFLRQYYFNFFPDFGTTLGRRIQSRSGFPGLYSPTQNRRTWIPFLYIHLLRSPTRRYHLTTIVRSKCLHLGTVSLPLYIKNYSRWVSYFADSLPRRAASGHRISTFFLQELQHPGRYSLCVCSIVSG